MKSPLVDSFALLQNTKCVKEIRVQGAAKPLFYCELHELVGELHLKTTGDFALTGILSAI